MKTILIFFILLFTNPLMAAQPHRLNHSNSICGYLLGLFTGDRISFSNAKDWAGISQRYAGDQFYGQHISLKFRSIENPSRAVRIKGIIINAYPNGLDIEDFNGNIYYISSALHEFKDGKIRPLTTKEVLKFRNLPGHEFFKMTSPFKDKLL